MVGNMTLCLHFRFNTSSAKPKNIIQHIDNSAAMYSIYWNKQKLDDLHKIYYIYVKCKWTIISMYARIKKSRYKLKYELVICTTVNIINDHHDHWTIINDNMVLSVQMYKHHTISNYDVRNKVCLPWSCWFPFKITETSDHTIHFYHWYTWYNTYVVSFNFWYI